MSSAKEAVPALILGYWRTIVAPPMVFARNMAEVKKEMEAKGFVKPMVASLPVMSKPMHRQDAVRVPGGIF